jgi:hypothetical protein
MQVPAGWLRLSVGVVLRIVSSALSWMFASRNAALPAKAVVLRAWSRPYAAVAAALAAAALAGVPATVSAAGGRTAAHAVPGAAAGSWGTAISVPGLAALNRGGASEVVSLSCASAGNCTAGGHYGNRHGQQGFVASERQGRWSAAVAVPGLAALNTGGGADVLSASCSSAGNCAAGGYYSYSVAFFRTDAFVVTEHGGTWGKAVALPTGDGYVDAVSCPSTGNCLAGGSTGADYTSNHQAFFVEEHAGRWGHLKTVPGLRNIKHVYSWISSVSCPSAGNCGVGGIYEDRSGHQQAFVADERNGVWGTAIEVPGLADLNVGGSAAINSVSCGSVGDCAVGGYYTDGSNQDQGFVASEQDGSWGTATQVPGLAARTSGGSTYVNAVSCDSGGDCAAGGHYTNTSGLNQGFVASEQNGVWGTAIPVPGLATLNKPGKITGVLTVSCASAGNCAAGGFYYDRDGNRQGFVASEAGGTWGHARAVRGLATLNSGGFAEVVSVSCGSPGACAGGGYYKDSHQNHGFVTQAG